MAETDLELAQLLCTRLCHDLAGPIGAVAAGVELIGDDPAMADPETIGLIGDSSSAASRKLKFMRAALGAPQGPASDVKSLLDGYLEATTGPGVKAHIGWPDAALLDASAKAFGPAWGQTLLNLCLLALELQPGCKGLSLEIAPTPLAAVVRAQGPAGRTGAMRETLQAVATTDGGNALTAKTVQAYLAGRLVRTAGGVLTVESNPDGVAVTASFPHLRV